MTYQPALLSLRNAWASVSRVTRPSVARLRRRPVLFAAVALAAVLLIVMVAIAIVGRNTIADMTDPQGALLVENFDEYPAGERWRDGERHGQWRAEYDGYGSTMISADGGHRLTMSPMVSNEPHTTHSGLVTTIKQFDNIDITTQLQTMRQLRSGGANSWEVAWLLWHYTDEEHFYSLVLKQNGWELGKEDPAYPGSQRYLATGHMPTFPIGTQHTVRVRQEGNSMSVWVDDQLLASFTDEEHPYSGGRIGLYTEDAYVAFDNVVVRRP